ALLAVGVYLIYRAARQTIANLPQPPAELRQPRVLTGDGLLAKDVFSSDSRLSQVQAMSFGQVEPGQPDELCSVSNFGALFIDDDGATKRYTPYGMQHVKVLGMNLQAAGARVSRFQIVDLAGTGECSFLARDNALGSELIGHDGKPVWQLGRLDFRSHPGDMAAAELYKDGKIEFVAAYALGRKGIGPYDGAVNQPRSTPDLRPSRVELVDLENGKKAIACSEGAGVTILAPQGNLGRKFDVNSYSDDFIVLTWPPASDVQYLLFRNGGNLDLYDLNGKLTFECPVPNVAHIYRFRAIGFKAGNASYLATVATTTFSENRTIFCVFGLPEHPLRNQTVHAPLYEE